MTLREYKNYIHSLEKHIYDAISPIIDKIKLPPEVEISDIDIPLLDVRTIGDEYKKYLCGKIVVSSNFTIHGEW